MTGPGVRDWLSKHRSVVAYFMILALVAGLFSAFRLGRSEDPPLAVRTMAVRATWPGATVGDTLRQVTERLERKLQETPRLDVLRSTTGAGVATVLVTLEGSTSAREAPAIWDRVRKSVGDIRHTLPAGVVGPGFDDTLGDTFPIVWAFTGDGFSHRELRDEVEGIRSRLLQVPGVSRIETVGAQDERITVELSMPELAARGIDRAGVLAALQAQSIAGQTGTVEAGSEALSLRVSGTFRSEQDIAHVDLAVDGRTVRLGDIARVRRDYADPPQPLLRVDGAPAIGLAIAMREGGDILVLGRDLERAMTEITATLPVGVERRVVANEATAAANTVAGLTTALWQAIALVLAACFAALGPRPGLMIALAIPLAFAIAVPGMQLAGIDLQRISLGALVVALAFIAGDAVTTADAMHDRLAQGAGKAEAAAYASRTWAGPLLAGALATIAALLPAGLAASPAGEFTASLFAVVAIAVLASWVVAVVFLPLLGAVVPDLPGSGGAGPALLGRVQDWYRRHLTRAMRARWATVGLAAVSLGAAMLALPLIPRQLFPASDRPELLVDLRLPRNASIRAGEGIAGRFDAVLRGDPDVARWSTWVGRGAVRFHPSLDARSVSNAVAQSVIVAKDASARDRLHARLEKELAEQFPGLVARVGPLEIGPRVGWPLQYRVSGPDLARVRDIAFQLAQFIAANRDAVNVNFDWIEPAREVHVRIDREKARALGLGSQALAGTLDALLSGTTVSQVRDGLYLVDVIASSKAQPRLSLETLADLPIPLANGRRVPLRQLATFDHVQADPTVGRRNRVPTLTVQADVARSARPEGVAAALAPAVEGLAGTLPRPYRIAAGGAAEEGRKALASLVAALPAMALLMLTVLMLHLQSFRRAGLILAVAPLGLIGVVAALLLSSRPLGFVAILGILALFGLLARNAILVLGRIDAEAVRGKPAWQAAVDAGSACLPSMALTALAATLAMIPLATASFWGALAFAIMGGALVGTALTLLLLPTLYVICFGDKEAGVEIVAQPPAVAEASIDEVCHAQKPSQRLALRKVQR
jgi:multidrug efflux pump subunit AcrB